jgi:hypothetical protein
VGNFGAPATSHSQAELLHRDPYQGIDFGHEHVKLSRTIQGVVVAVVIVIVVAVVTAVVTEEYEGKMKEKLSGLCVLLSDSLLALPKLYQGI